MRRMFVILLLCSVAAAQNSYRILNSFNAGELSPLLSSREDLAKFQSGCSIMENMIPLPQGGAAKRPGTKYIAAVKTSSLATRIIPFEYSTEQSYIIELGNQYMRFFTDGAAVLTGEGTETLTDVDDGNLVSHWLLNDATGTTVINADNPGTMDGTASADASILHADGFVGTGCFDLDGQYTVGIGDADALSFTANDTDDEPFSIACWANVTAGDLQVLLSKWQVDAASKEYRLSLSSTAKLQLHLADTGTNLDSDIIANWKLNDAEATQVVLDDTDNSHDMTTETANTTDLSATGKTDTCLDFGGADCAILDADDANFTFVEGIDGSFSISAWIYFTETGLVQTIISKFDDSVTLKREWLFNVTTDNALIFSVYDETNDKVAYRYTNLGLTEGWRHVAVTYDGDHASWTGATAADYINLYVDNVRIIDSTGVNDDDYVKMVDQTTKVIIGALNRSSAYVYYFADKIDNVAVYSKVLTPSDISTLYNSGAGTESSVVREISAVSDDALDLGWHFIAATYSAPDNASATAANSIILYVDGVAVDSTKTNDPCYVAMQDGDEEVRIGSQRNSGDDANELFWQDKIDEVSIFNDVLTPDEIAGLYSTTPYEIETPYFTADLFELKYEQSADVLYITHPDYETRKLARYANVVWTITAADIRTGPFRTENSDVADFLSANATTGTVTLTATGHTPFILGTTAGHQPSGTVATSKSQTGALFRFSHPLGEPDFVGTYDTANDYTDCGTIFKGGGWDLTTAGTWRGTVLVQRNYTIGAAWNADGWETVYTCISGTANGLGTEKNFTTGTTRTEDFADADYQVIYTVDWGGEVEILFETDQTEQIGIVEITAVTSSTTAIGTVLKTLGSTDATHKWSEGAWSNYRGWPQTVMFFEDRLMFGGNISQPDTIWGSVTSDYENFTEGAEDDDALNFTLSSRQVNVIEWLIGKNKILIGTSGAEWTLDGAADEPLSPSSVEAIQQSTYGSANLQATLANESVLFFQRGAEKMRELAYNWELDSYVAPDMTILANQIADDGIVDTAFQKTPDSILWCARTDGELPIFSYERKENITAWSRLITEDSSSDSDFESVARIHGDPEDEIWVIVERMIDDETARYIEQFQPRDFGSDPCDAFYVDCGATYTTDVNSITDLTWLEGESVVALADGEIITDLTVDSNTVTLGGVYQQVQIGIPYTVQLRTMPLSWIEQGVTIQGRIKRISEVVARWYESGDFSIGKDADTLQTYSITGQTTSVDRKTFPPGFSREGYVFVYQRSPEPLTLLSIMLEFKVQ